MLRGLPYRGERYIFHPPTSRPCRIASEREATLKVKALHKVIIREELVELTGNYKLAVLLHELDWRQRDAFNKTGAVCWFSRTTGELVERTLMKLSPQTIMRMVRELEAGGWLEIRDDPGDVTGRRKQYRVNVLKLRDDLDELGFPLEGWAFSKTEDGFSIKENASSKMEKGSSKTENHYGYSKQVDGYTGGSCDRCKESPGWYYPEGIGKGNVAKCDHKGAA
jgi:hypothetical protein